ncbi:MAG: serine/threonine protein kinase [Candidatus Wallbacteria bacterium]|nr:serine/threonine protein kinase [Candidatus Wallbacteria bacterium]
MTPERLGPYKIVDRVGAGGMGEVYKGVHETTEQVVAIKVLHSSEEEDTQLLKRFRREIVSAGRLSHDNIVRLFESGEEDDFIWYAMEYIDGSSLSDLLAKTEQMPVPQALAIAQDICKAFVYMHSRGFVHRDIKPGNIMVARDGRSKLVDFGLVKSRFATNITVTGVVIGTPAYMSPEMLQGRDVDHRSDIFQLGQVVYRMLAGGGAFDGLNSFEIASNCITNPPKPLVARNPKVSAALETVIFHCLEKKPEERYQSAADILNDFKRAEKGLKPALCLFLVARATGGYEFRNLKLHSGIRVARLAWESEKPYATRAAYAPAGAREPPQEVVNATETETTHHTLELKGLDPDADYQLWIVYPGKAQSLPQTFRTQKASLRNWSYTYRPDGTPRLAFETPAPAVATVKYGLDKSVREAAGTPSTSHSAVLTGADLFGEGSVQIQCVTPLGEEWTAQPVPLPDARAAARDLARALEPHQAKLVNLMAALDRAEHQKKLDTSMVKDALPRATMESIARFAPLGPLFFSSRRPSLDDKLGLYKLLSLVDALERYCARRKLPFACGVPALLGPDFGPAAEPRLGDSEPYKYTDGTRLMPAGSGAAISDLASTFGKSTRQLAVPLNITGAAMVARAELIVSVSWQEIFLFEDQVVARINKSTELVMRRDPRIPLGAHDWRFVHSFDPRALAEGANEIEVTLHALPGLHSVTGIDVNGVELRVTR